jgi:hypothetical protein
MSMPTLSAAYLELGQLPIYEPYLSQSTTVRGGQYGPSYEKKRACQNFRFQGVNLSSGIDGMLIQILSADRPWVLKCLLKRM